MEVISEPLSPNNFVHRQSGITIGQRQEEVPASGSGRENHATGNPGTNHALTSESLTGRDVPLRTRTVARLGRLFLYGIRVEDELDESTSDQTRGQMGRKIVVKEKLTAHKIEWEVVSCPGKPEEARRVV